METGTSSLMSTSEPAEATSPARVKISGRPAATSAPKATTRIARVTGQENISDFRVGIEVGLVAKSGPQHRGARRVDLDAVTGERLD